MRAGKAFIVTRLKNPDLPTAELILPLIALYSSLNVCFFRAVRLYAFRV